MAKAKRASRDSLVPYYSGPASMQFWARINALGNIGDGLYLCGCLLQNMEEDVLRWLTNQEQIVRERALEAKRKGNR